MRSVLLILSVFLPLALLSQNKAVSIVIEQGNVYQRITTREELLIRLKKEPFKIIVTLEKLEGVYLFADFTDSIYRLKEQEKIPDFENLPGMAMAEASFNEEQELIISKDGWAYWFYDEKEDWHRFDKDIKVAGDSVTGTKTIKQFFIAEDKSTLPVAEVKEPLYLFFLAVSKTNKKGIPTKELIRMKAKIDWE